MFSNFGHFAACENVSHISEGVLETGIEFFRRRHKASTKIRGPDPSLVRLKVVEDSVAVLDHWGTGACDGREAAEACRKLEVSLAAAEVISNPLFIN